MAKKNAGAPVEVEAEVANANDRFTPLAIGGVTYSLVYDFDAVVKAEELAGIALLVGVDWTNVGVARIRAMLFASMVTAQPEITLAEITALVTFANILKIEAALVKAWATDPKSAPVEVKAAADAKAA